MTKILRGAPVADQLKEEMAVKVNTYINQGINPKIAILRVGNRPDDLAYEARVFKNCQKIGMDFESVYMDDNTIMVDLIDRLNKLNKNPDIHGILIFRPLPAQLDERIVAKAINPEKDIDCMSPENWGKVFAGETTGLGPCTPLAVIALLNFYGYELSGLNVVVINRSMVLGKPLSMMLLASHSTVTICHSKTKDLAILTRQAEVVVTGVGRPKYFGRKFFTDQSSIIDVGINFDGDQMCGDVDYEAVSDCCAAITPVPGGIGAVTSMVLLQNVIKALDIQQIYENKQYREE